MLTLTKLSTTQDFGQDADGDCVMFFYLEPRTKHGTLYRRHLRVMFLGEREYAPTKTIVTAFGATDDVNVSPQTHLFSVEGQDTFLPACEAVIQMLRVLDIANEAFIVGDELATVVNAFLVPHHGRQS